MNDYARIARVIRYLDSHQREQPNLAGLAEVAGLSPYHFNRLFVRWAGITPKGFLQCLTVSHAKERLRRGESVLDASLESGLSGPGRLHDLCVKLEAASPGEIKTGGAAWTITAGFAESPFGICLIGESPRGICHLSFVDSRDRAAASREILGDWPRARLSWDDAEIEELAGRLFVRNGTPAAHPELFRAFVRGSRFQVCVWRALLQIPRGALVSYGHLATAIGHTGAARATGTAIGRNPLAYLVPCHRVILETGALGGYRWGSERKRALIVWETSPRKEVSSKLSRRATAR